ncbi:MAG: anti-sigma factor [Roseimicrobium sp.]
MTERQEEQLALHALSALSDEEARLLESDWRYDKRMQETYAELQHAAAHMALLLPPEPPPQDLRAQLLNKIKQRRRAKFLPRLARLGRQPAVAWAAAAVFAVAAVGFWLRERQAQQRLLAMVSSDSAVQALVSGAREEARTMEEKWVVATSENARLAAELNTMRQSYAVSSMELAMLRPNSKRYEGGTALVAWNQERQEGIIRFEHMPPAQAAKDYQLWIVCRKQPLPVSAGVVRVNEQGLAVVVFKPVRHIAELAQFAVSLENEGGAAVPGTQMVLASQ